MTEIHCSISKSVSALDFNFERAVGCSILTAGKKLSGKSECNNSGYKLTGLTWWGSANSRFLGLVYVGAARSLDQTALRPSVIKRIRQMTLHT